MSKIFLYRIISFNNKLEFSQVPFLYGLTAIDFA